MDAALDSAVRGAGISDDSAVAATLLSVSSGLDSALNRSEWNTETILATVALLGRLPEGAPARLVLGYFFAHQPWRDRYSDLAKRLHDVLPRRSSAEQRALALAWVRLALQAIDEQMADKHTMQRVELPINELQQSVFEFLKRAAARVFADDAVKQQLHGMLSRLSEAHREQLSQRGRGASPLGAAGGYGGGGGNYGGGGYGGGGGYIGGGGYGGGPDVPWTSAPLAPQLSDLDSRLCPDPKPNLTKGSYSTASEYLVRAPRRKKSASPCAR